MKTRSIAALLLLVAAACAPKSEPPMNDKPTTSSAKRFRYPEARKDDVVDDYHGTKVADPYRWLENPDSPETQAWVKAQNEITFGYLRSVAEREAIGKRITQLYDYEKLSTPWKEGGRYFWYKNDGLQQHSVLYTAESLDAAPRVLIDPNGFSADGTVALGPIAISKDGKKIAYSTTEGGSDWHVFKVRDVETGKDLPDQVKWVKFSGASWSGDGKGFYYSRYPAPKEGQALEESNYFHKLYFHRLGEPQEKDELVIEFPDQKEWGAGGMVSDDGRWLFISVWKGTGPQNLLYYKDLTKKDAKIVRLVDEWEAEYSIIDAVGSVFYVKTDKDAPRGRVIAIDTAKPDPKNWREIVPQQAETLQYATLVGDTFFANYLKDAKSLVRLHDRDGKHLRDVSLPGIGSVGGFGGKRTDTETFYSFTSFTTPGEIYRYDVKTHTSSLYKRPALKFDPAKFEVRQVFYTSKDGTKVPMFLTHKKGLKLDGSNPTYLYGYGGFNVPVTPSFAASIVVWMEMGGVYAVANIRGGSEYGEDWHQAGIRDRKQNVFDDFIAAAEWLIANEYTSSKKLAIGGGSNGGLLVGACITQRPDLYAAAIPQVGVLDMLRFHKFTIGWAWVDDYGSSDDPNMFPYLHRYSPLHALKPGTKYPSVLITTADHDDRVVPAHSFKFAAALQAAHAGENPVLIRIETKAGHGAGKPTKKMIEEAADRWAFLVKELGVRVPAEITGATASSK